MVESLTRAMPYRSSLSQQRRSYGSGTKRSASIFRKIYSTRSRWAATDAETARSNSSIARPEIVKLDRRTTVR
jgi:hypothetical protein